MTRWRHRAAILLAASSAAGCWTVAAPSLPALESVPPAATAPPTVGYRAQEFWFAQDDGEPKPSLLDGHLLAEEILDGWRARSWIGEARRLDEEQPKTEFAWVVTLSGLQRNRAGFFAQGFNLITLTLLPYTVTHEYDLELVLEDTATASCKRAQVKAADETWVELFLVFAFPWSSRGHQETMSRVGDSLYDALARQEAGACG